MKIILISHTAYPDFLGGREYHMHSLAVNLAKTDEVIVLAGGKTKNVNIRKISGYKLITLPMISIRVSKNPLQIYRIIMSLGKRLKKESPDIVHAFEYGSFSTGAAWFYAKKQKIPFFLTSYGYQLGNYALKAGKAVYDRTVGKQILKTANKIFCPSSVQKGEIERILLKGSGDDKIIIQPNCIDINDYKQIVFSKELLEKYKLKGVLKIVCICRILPRKGLRYLVLAIERLVKIEKKDKLKLLIIGPDCGQKKELEFLINQKKLNSYIEIPGGFPHRKTQEFLAASDVFVLPSLYEGLPIALIEAMAAKKAVVFSRLDCAGDLISHNVNGLLARPKDAKDLADQIGKLYENDKLRDKLSAAAVETARKFDIKNEASRVREIYAAYEH